MKNSIGVYLLEWVADVVNASSALSQSSKAHDAHHNPYDTAIFHSGANYPVIRQASQWAYRGSIERIVHASRADLCENQVQVAFAHS